MRDAQRRFLRHHPSVLAAGFAYFTIFSMIPFFVILLAVFGRIVGVSMARDELLNQMRIIISPEASDAAGAFLTAAVRLRTGAVTALSALLVIFGASRMFNHLQAAINMIWEIETPKGGIVRRFLRARAKSFAILVGVYGVMLIFFLFGLAAAAANVWIVKFLPGLGASPAWKSIHLFSAIVIPFGLFILIFKFIPTVKVRWGDAVAGAALTTALFSAARTGISLYLSMSHLQSIFGIAGSVIVIMIWFYFSSLILFYGAAFTREYGDRDLSRAHKFSVERP
jgi:membrane protein